MNTELNEITNMLPSAETSENSGESGRTDVRPQRKASRQALRLVENVTESPANPAYVSRQRWNGDMVRGRLLEAIRLHTGVGVDAYNPAVFDPIDPVAKASRSRARWLEAIRLHISVGAYAAARFDQVDPVDEGAPC